MEKEKNNNLIDKFMKEKVDTLNLSTGPQNIFSASSNTYKYSSRLNGYDVSMMRNITSDDNLDDEVVRLSVEIDNKETSLEELRGKILSTERLGRLPEVLNLKIKEKELEREITDLKTKYSQKKSVIKPIVETQLKKKKMSLIRRIQWFISRKILAKVSKKFNSIMVLSDSLEMLAGINKSVDELIDMKVPYGEHLENYEKLTSYLYKANKIHSKILKTMAK